jgi:hypothetical protein
MKTKIEINIEDQPLLYHEVDGPLESIWPDSEDGPPRFLRLERQGTTKNAAWIAWFDMSSDFVYLHEEDVSRLRAGRRVIQCSSEGMTTRFRVGELHQQKFGRGRHNSLQDADLASAEAYMDFLFCSDVWKDGLEAVSFGGESRSSFGFSAWVSELYDLGPKAMMAQIELRWEMDGLHRIGDELSGRDLAMLCLGKMREELQELLERIEEASNV